LDVFVHDGDRRRVIQNYPKEIVMESYMDLVMDSISNIFELLDVNEIILRMGRNSFDPFNTKINHINRRLESVSFFGVRVGPVFWENVSTSNIKKLTLNNCTLDFGSSDKRMNSLRSLVIVSRYSTTNNSETGVSLLEFEMSSLESLFFMGGYNTALAIVTNLKTLSWIYTPQTILNTSLPFIDIIHNNKPKDTLFIASHFVPCLNDAKDIIDIRRIDIVPISDHNGRSPMYLSMLATMQTSRVSVVGVFVDIKNLWLELAVCGPIMKSKTLFIYGFDKTKLCWVYGVCPMFLG